MSKFHKLPRATVRNGDHPNMIAAINRLQREQIDARRPVNSNHQLKFINGTSFYPNKGTIFVDEEPGARAERGLDALISLMRGSDGPDDLRVELDT